MKIAVAGKGGSGKTTIAGTLARVLARRGESVLAIDADSNPNLAISLGVPREQVVAPLPGSLLQRFADAEGQNQVALAMPVQEIKRRYGFPVVPGLDLVEMARIDHAGAGWKCHAHATVRELTAAVAEQSREHVVLDMEAGLEHLSRGTARNATTVLGIAEPYYKSLETAARVCALAAELGVRQVLAVANKVRPGDVAGLREFAARRHLELAAEIPYDESVAEADRLGIAPIDHDVTAVWVQQVDALADRLMRL